MYVDAHCHLAHPLWGEDLALAISRAKVRGISQWIAGGIDPNEWKEQLALAQAHRLKPVFGIHPWTVSRAGEEAVARYFSQLESLGPLAAAIGECGLDFHFHPDQKESQLFWFNRQLELAKALAKPLVLHVVRAHSETLKALKNQAPSWSGLVHRFSGGMGEASLYLGLGFTLSVGGPEVLKPSPAKLDLWRSIPPDRLVLETDAPWDQRHGVPLADQLGMLIPIATEVARARGEDADTLLRRSTENLNRIFS